MMKHLAKSFRAIKPFSALVIGDFFVDTYTSGRVKRISPEAPVQVLEVEAQESRPGGAGNAAKNIAAIGGQVQVLGRIGSDLEGRQLQAELTKYGIDASQLVQEPGYKTPVKNRLIAGSQQLLRVDFEAITSLTEELNAVVIEQLRTIIPTVQVVAISDYGKGFLSRAVLQATIEIAQEASVPVIVDPKGTDFTKYKSATLIKPNLSEAYAAAKLPSSANLDLVAQELLQQTNANYLLITRSEAGISLFEAQGKRSDFPVQSKEVKDVTGAGDTVLAIMSLAIANQFDLATATQLANIAAGLSIERLGCVQVTLPEIAKRLLDTDIGCKIFDEQHSHALAQVLQDRKYILLAVDPAQEMTHAFLRTLRQLAQGHTTEILVYVQRSDTNADFIHLLSRLDEVDFILLEGETLEEFHPHAVFAIQNGELRAQEQGKDILSALLTKGSPGIKF